MALFSPTLFFGLGLGLAFLFPEIAPAGTSPTPTVSATKAEFSNLCEELRNGSNPYFGSAQIRHIENVLDNQDLELLPRIKGLATLGREHLRLGENDTAISNFEESITLAADSAQDPLLVRALLAELGLAYLRLGEITNCVGFHTPSMCIFPIAPAGRHPKPEASRRAMRAFLRFLETGPYDPSIHWLLVIAAMTIGEYPDGLPPALRLPQNEPTSGQDLGFFRDVAGAVGLSISDNSGGGVMDDFDGDGRLDIVTSSVEPCTPLRFFRNNGRGGFDDHAPGSGLDDQLGGGNLVQADFDGDGHLDLFVLRGGWFGASGRIRNSLLKNLGPTEDGQIEFADVTAEVGLSTPAYPTQTAAWADYDNDGDLDLYVGNEGNNLSRDCCFPSQLFRNETNTTSHTNGGGEKSDGLTRFTDVAAAAGVTNLRFAKGVTWGDYDNDGDADLYVSNLGPNRLYRNDGRGADGRTVRFTDVAPQLGLTEPAGRSFPTWFFDYDNDGDLDLFVAEYQGKSGDVAEYLVGRSHPGNHPRLYRNEGPGADGVVAFTEVSLLVGLDAPSLPMGANFGDLDNDGFLDLYLGTGDTPFQTVMPNLMYRNLAGRLFVDVTYATGFGHLQKGHGVAFGDIDDDGDQDVFEQMGGAYPGDAYPSVLYENPGHGNGWITLELHGTHSNRSAIGARLELELSGPDGSWSVHRQVGSGGSFGGSSLRQEIGLGRAHSIRRVRVHWPTTGLYQTFSNVALNRAYRLQEGVARLEPIDRQAIALRSSRPGHRAHAHPGN